MSNNDLSTVSYSSTSSLTGKDPVDSDIRDDLSRSVQNFS